MKKLVTTLALVFGLLFGGVAIAPAAQAGDTVGGPDGCQLGQPCAPPDPCTGHILHISVLQDDVAHWRAAAAASADRAAVWQARAIELTERASALTTQRDRLRERTERLAAKVAELRDRLQNS